MIFLCDCFARFAEVLRRLADDYETLAHSKAEVRNRDWRKRVSGIENRLSRNQSGSWTYRLLGHSRYEPSGACTGRECGKKCTSCQSGTIDMNTRMIYTFGISFGGAR